MKSKLHFDTLVMIFAIVILVALTTWLVPGGEYQREVKNGRTYVVPNTFKYTESQPQGIGAILVAPIKGFIQAAHIIAFVLVLGGSFMIINRTGAINVAMNKCAITFSKKPHLQKFFIPITMTMFSIGGAVFGMCESAMPFVLIFIPLALSLGYDSIVGTAIPFLGAAAGFAGAVFNPFTVGIAQAISELPIYSGMEYRLVIWAISTASMITFVMLYASKIRKNPEKSVVYNLDLEKKIKLQENSSNNITFSINHKIVLLIFVLAMAILVFGILKLKWFINEIAALFLGLGILSGIFGKLKPSEITDSFKAGARDMIGVALIIGCARAILVIATDGKIMDVLLYNVSRAILDLNPVLAAQAMFITQGIINFFVHSGSAQAALTMPIMAPLADVIGISRQIAVLAFQFGEGWINPILPTSGVTMGVLGLAGISWEKWFKWMLPLQVYFLLLAFFLIYVAFLINYQ